MGALVNVSGGAVVEPAKPLTPAVQRGITDLTIAFQAGVQRSDSDRIRGLQLYAEAVSEFHPAIVEATMRWMLVHNPRNPFPPTTQDVHEACQATQGNWLGSILDHFRIGERRYSYDRYTSATSKPRGASFGHIPPMTPGCAAPPDLVIDLLRRRLWVGFDGELRQMSDAEFAALPVGALASEHLERLLVERAKRAQSEAERIEREAPWEANREGQQMPAERFEAIKIERPDFGDWLNKRRSQE